MRPTVIAALVAALLATGCGSVPVPTPAPTPTPTPAPPPLGSDAALPRAAAAAQAPSATAPAPGSESSVSVAMTLVAGLGPVERSPEALRRRLSAAPPAGLALAGLPEGTWTHGQAPLTNTVGVNFALSADRSELWFDGNRDGVLTQDEHRRGGRRAGPILWHDELPALTERELEGETHRTEVFMAVGAQPNSMDAFSRLDGHRAGILTVSGQPPVLIASIDRTFRGWYQHPSRDRLMVDTDGDGSFETSEDSHESYRLGEPIPLGDLDYVATDFGLFGESLVFVPSERKARRMQALGLGHPAPEISGIALDGSEVRLSAHRGSWVFLDFWATWCGPCLQELPHLKKLQAAHPELVVLGISGDRQRQALEAYLERSPLPWAQIYDDEARLRREYRVQSLPTSYLVAPDGTIAAKNLRGAGMESRFQREVESWQAERSSAEPKGGS